jgi:ATP-dependent DNA helicase RecG
MELLEFHERLRLAVKIGESQYREFKSAFEGPPENKKPRQINDICRNVGKTLVAFANAEGGELFIGLEDNGDITGVPYNNKDIETIFSAYKTHVHEETPLPKPKTAKIEVEDKNVLYLAVPKGLDFVYLTSDGRCLKRRDRDTIPVSSERISAVRNEIASRDWERQIAPGATIDDLDLDILKSTSGQIAFGLSVEKFLQHLDLAEFGLDGLRIKKAALLLFAKDIKRYHPGCIVRIFTINGKEKRSGAAFNVTRDEIISNNIFRLIDESWQRLMVAIIKHTEFTEQVKFKETYLYPEIACREALLNAIVHRNYAIEGRGIEIEIYNDRMEIKSPGRLLSTVSLDDLRARTGAHESRNPLIARVLREVGYIREMGEGIRRIYDVMRSNSLAEPLFENERSDFRVALFHISMYDPGVKLWLSKYEKYKLTENQMAVLSLGYNGSSFSTQDVIDRLGIVDTDHVREVLTPLRSQGLIERVLNRNQAYLESQRKRIPKREVKTFRVAEIAHVDDFSNKLKESKTENGDELLEEKDEGVEYFIGNINYRTSKGELYEHLSSFAEVISLSMPPNNFYNQENKGYAFAKLKLPSDSNNFKFNHKECNFQGKELVFRKQKK